MATVQRQQNMLDIAMQEAGNIEAVFAIAKQNGLSITKRLAVGTELATSGLATNAIVLADYRKNKIVPATSDDSTFVGIGHWIIGDDFIIT